MVHFSGSAKAPVRPCALRNPAPRPVQAEDQGDVRGERRRGRSQVVDVMYWLISLPLTEGRDVVWTRVQSKVKFESDLSQIYRFKLPELRVGTLDSLLALSDDLVKVPPPLLRPSLMSCPPHSIGRPHRPRSPTSFDYFMSILT